MEDHYEFFNFGGLIKEAKLQKKLAEKLELLKIMQSLNSVLNRVIGEKCCRIVEYGADAVYVSVEPSDHEFDIGFYEVTAE